MKNWMVQLTCCERLLGLLNMSCDWTPTLLFLIWFEHIHYLFPTSSFLPLLPFPLLRLPVLTGRHCFPQCHCFLGEFKRVSEHKCQNVSVCLHACSGEKCYSSSFYASWKQINPLKAVVEYFNLQEKIFYILNFCIAVRLFLKMHFPNCFFSISIEAIMMYNFFF